MTARLFSYSIYSVYATWKQKLPCRYIRHCCSTNFFLSDNNISHYLLYANKNIPPIGESRYPDNDFLPVQVIGEIFPRQRYILFSACETCIERTWADLSGGEVFSERTGPFLCAWEIGKSSLDDWGSLELLNSKITESNVLRILERLNYWIRYSENSWITELNGSRTLEFRNSIIIELWKVKHDTSRSAIKRAAPVNRLSRYLPLHGFAMCMG